jgi:hypothetical protein
VCHDIAQHPSVQARRVGNLALADEAEGLKRPGFSGGSFHWAMQPYRGSRGLHSSCLRLQRGGCAR